MKRSLIVACALLVGVGAWSSQARAANYIISEGQGDERRATLEAMQRLEEQTATGELAGQPSGHIHIDEHGAAHVVR